MIFLEKKFVLHVPLFKCENDELISTDVDISDLTDCLSKSGFDGAYVTKAKGIYKSRCFDELLVTIFASSDEPKEIFIRWFQKNNHLLGQEALAYECDGKLFVMNLIE